MIWFLAGVSALYGVLGEVAEALVLLAAIVPLVGMDAFLHRRTQVSTQSLKSRLAERATVVRDGAALEIPALELVPGDVAVVLPAQAFPADGIIVGGADLQADESSLTGEAYPVAKRPCPDLPSGSAEPLVDASHWGFAGTRLLTGRAVLRVAFTGGETLYGEIVRSAAQGEHARTPLQGAIQHLVSVLLVAAGLTCAILAVVRMAQGHGWLDALLSAVTLAAAAIPEEFPWSLRSSSASASTGSPGGRRWCGGRWPWRTSGGSRRSARTRPEPSRKAACASCTSSRPSP